MTQKCNNHFKYIYSPPLEKVLVAPLVLYYKCYTKLQIYEFSYNFDTVLYQFLETGTSDRCLICIVQLLRFPCFILYPLSFFLYSPFQSLTFIWDNPCLEVLIVKCLKKIDGCLIFPNIFSPLYKYLYTRLLSRPSFF